MYKNNYFIVNKEVLHTFIHQYVDISNYRSVRMKMTGNIWLLNLLFVLTVVTMLRARTAWNPSNVSGPLLTLDASAKEGKWIFSQYSILFFNF